ncbi:MAG: NADH-quinone oxidoreductase subunit J [Terriglobia bacterium]
MEQLVFFALAAIIVFGSLMVVFSESPIHSVLFLFIVLFCLAGLYLLLNAPFLAAVQVLIYAGAITVLVLFVVMLTTPYLPSVRLLQSKQSDAAFLVVGFFLLALVSILTTAEWFEPASGPGTEAATTAELGLILFRDYVLPFELASVVLLAAVIGAVYMVAGVKWR